MRVLRTKLYIQVFILMKKLDSQLIFFSIVKKKVYLKFYNSALYTLLNGISHGLYLLLWTSVKFKFVFYFHAACGLTNLIIYCNYNKLILN